MLKYSSSGYGVLHDACGTLSLPNGCFGKKKNTRKEKREADELINHRFMNVFMYLLINLSIVVLRFFL